MSFALTKTLYEAIIGVKTHCIRIQFIPGSDLNIAVHTSDGICDIGITKKTYLAIFTEGHSFFNEKYPIDTKLLIKEAENELWEFYYATIALLSTTNEHMTAWRVHEDIVWTLVHKGLLSLEEEAAFIMALATSKFDRINKSLVLWYWVRTLYCAGSFEPSNGSSFRQLMEQVLRSMEAHFCNYAAGFTAAWLMQVARLDGKNRLDIIELIRCVCKKNVTDVSLWTLMGSVLLNEINHRIVSDCLRIQKKLADRGIDVFIRQECAPSVFVIPKTITDELLQWLLAVEAPYRTPYEQLLRNPVGIDLKSVLKEKETTRNLPMADVVSFLLKNYT